MKHLILTISLILGAAAVSADIYYGKDALNIITNGQIVNEQLSGNNSIKLPNYFKYLTIIKDKDAFMCSLEMEFSSRLLTATCVDVDVK